MHLFGPSPAHPSPALVAFAFAVFFAFRLAAYLLAGKALGKAFDSTSTSAFAIALVRVVIGIAGGFAFVHVLAWLNPLPEDPVIAQSIFLMALFALRVVEWRFTIGLFFDKADSKRSWFCSVLGGLYSHFLDVPSWLILWLVFQNIDWFGCI